MNQPANSNCRLAQLKLEQLAFVQAIGWQQTIDGGQIARWRRGDLLATLVLEGRRLTIALTSASNHSIPSVIAEGAPEVAQALNDAGAVFVAKPEGVWP